MKVCMITSTYPLYREEPAPSFVHEVTKELVKLGLQVHVVAPHHVLSKDEEEMDGVAVHRFRYMPARLEMLSGGGGMPPKLQRSLIAKMELIPFFMSSFLKSVQACRRYDVDLIHAHWLFPSGLIGVLAKKILHRPLVLTGYGVEFFLVSRKYRVLAPLLRWIAANADQCVFISSAVKKTAEDLGIHGDRIIPYGVDTKKFEPKTMDGYGVSVLKSRYGIPDGRIILTVGRLVERKGFDYLIRSMPSVLRSVGDAVLVIAGDGPEREHLNSLTRELGLEDAVKLVGTVSNPDLPLLYNICTLFVLPSIVDSSGDQEGFGIVLCEAMACEKPVIGTKVGGILDIVTDGYDGVLVEQKSVDELSEAVLRVLSDDKFASKLRFNGRRTMLASFSYDRIASLYASIYHSLLEDVHGR